MLITFAGSTHSKYVTYLLETIAGEWTRKFDGEMMDHCPNEKGQDVDTEEEDNGEDGEEGTELSHGSMQMVNGELIIETSKSFDEDMDQIAGDFERFLNEMHVDETASVTVDDD
jgi:hypothetical protein